MRVLILDGSKILASLVERLVPADVEIEEVATFDEALASLRESPPDAVIANLGPSDLPWRELKEFCRNHRPQIPILFESCVYATADEAGIGSLNHSAAFIAKPYGVAQLRTELERLLRLDSSSGDDRAPASAAQRAPRAD